MEASGFSLSNPFYLVHQGQISDMATCSAEKRLDVVKELAGVNSFKKKEAATETEVKNSQRMLAEAEKEIEELEERKRTLETEQKELKEYISTDKERRALEFVIRERNRETAKKEADRMEKELGEAKEKEVESRKELEEAMEMKERRQEKVTELKRKSEGIERERKELMAEQENKLKKISQIEGDIAGIEETIDNSLKDKKLKQDKIAELEAASKAGKDEFEDIEKQWADTCQKSDKLGAKLEGKRKEQEMLYGRKARINEFR